MVEKLGTELLKNDKNQIVFLSLLFILHWNKKSCKCVLLFFVFSYYVRLTYRHNGTLTPWKLADCDYKCPLNDFISKTKDRVPEDRSKDCQYGQSTKVFTYKGQIVLFILIPYLFQWGRRFYWYYFAKYLFTVISNFVRYTFVNLAKFI